jgi:outer membrane lipoprotein SlyB
MKAMIYGLLLAATAILPTAWAGDMTTDAAIGGGVGGAVGGAIGAEVGDRNGAIVGSALGAAVGTAIATEDDHHDYKGEKADIPVSTVTHAVGHSHGKFCPPGQAKKGRC